MTETVCLQAALQYAGEHGWKIFPARMEAGKKYSWLSAEHAPGHENWGMTSDLNLLRENFSKSRWRTRCGVGIPTGTVNRIFVCEADTVRGHGVDGIAALRALELQHGALPATLMARSPSGSIHHYFNHPGGKIRSCTIAPGVDVKGDGGMVVAPPSVREDGVYEWLNDLPIADAPPWLVDLVREEERVKENGNGYDPSDPFDRYAHRVRNEPLAEEKIIEGCRIIADELPNPDHDWDAWNLNGMKIWRTAPDERGFEAFDGYSSRSSKYDEKATREKWAAFFKSPPTSITAGSFVFLVRECEPDWDTRETKTETWTTKEKEQSAHAIGPPVDLWGTFNAPELPRGLLPAIIENYAFAHAEQMGSDPAGFAMGALVACATVIPDRIKVQPKKHDPSFTQSARLWVALVGRASTLKSPIFRVVMKVISRIDSELANKSMRALEAWEALEPKEKKVTPKPPFFRLAIEDTTIEAVQEIAVDNQDGLIMSRNELSGWLASMEQYGGKKGGANAARPFYLLAYDGDKYTLDRVVRGHRRIECLSLNVFGGVQPDIIRNTAWGGNDDGLIERLLCIMLRKSGIDKDIPLPPEAKLFDALIDRLYKMRSKIDYDPVKLDDEALLIREEMVREHHTLTEVFEHSNRMLASHIGKFNGLFARLCLLWHVIEHHDDTRLPDINADTARRVARFMHEFLWHHSVAFYFGTLNVGDEHDRLMSVAGYILAHGVTEISNRMVQSSLNTFRNLKRREIEGTFEQMEALGWLDRKSPMRANDPPRWTVNPQVHDLYKERAKEEAVRRERVRTALIERKVYHDLDKNKEQSKNGDQQQ